VEHTKGIKVEVFTFSRKARRALLGYKPVNTRMMMARFEELKLL